jgi:hypothetical protein
LLQRSILQSTQPQKQQNPAEETPRQGFENLRSETLVVAAIRSRCGNPNNSGRYHGNRTRCRTRCGTTSRTRTSRLRHRVARECCEEERRYQLFHETPQKKETTSLMVPAH